MYKSIGVNTQYIGDITYEHEKTPP